MNEIEPAAGRKARKASETKKPRAKREPNIPPKIAKACELLSLGSAKNITQAAAMAGIHRVTLSRRLSEPHIRAHMLASARLDLLAAAPLAAKLKIEMMRSARSEVVRSDSQSEILALAGIQAARPPAAPMVQVNIGGGAGFVLTDDEPVDEEAMLRFLRGGGAGYVCDLRESTQRNRTAVDAEPWSEANKQV